MRIQQCDICGKDDKRLLEIQDSLKSSGVKDVCGKCEDEIDDYRNVIRNQQHDELAKLTIEKIVSMKVKHSQPKPPEPPKDRVIRFPAFFELPYWLSNFLYLFSSFIIVLAVIVMYAIGFGKMLIFFIDRI